MINTLNHNFLIVLARCACVRSTRRRLIPLGLAKESRGQRSQSEVAVGPRGVGSIWVDNCSCRWHSRDLNLLLFVVGFTRTGGLSPPTQFHDEVDVVLGGVCVYADEHHPDHNHSQSPRKGRGIWFSVAFGCNVCSSSSSSSWRR